MVKIPKSRVINIILYLIPVQVTREAPVLVSASSAPVRLKRVLLNYGCIESLGAIAIFTC